MVNSRKCQIIHPYLYFGWWVGCGARRAISYVCEVSELGMVKGRFIQ
jgi:hypothetical protein